MESFSTPKSRPFIHQTDWRSRRVSGTLLDASCAFFIKPSQQPSDFPIIIPILLMGKLRLRPVKCLVSQRPQILSYISRSLPTLYSWLFCFSLHPLGPRETSLFQTPSDNPGPSSVPFGVFLGALDGLHHTRRRPSTFLPLLWFLWEETGLPSSNIPRASETVDR